MDQGEAHVVILRGELDWRTEHFVLVDLPAVTTPASPSSGAGVTGTARAFTTHPGPAQAVDWSALRHPATPHEA